jgi:GAF domain-containing protein
MTTSNNNSFEQLPTKQAGQDTRGIRQWLFAPSDKIMKADARRQAQALATLLLLLSFSFLFGTLATLSADALVIGNVPLWLQLGVSFIVLAVAYGLSRTRHYMWGARLGLGILVLPIVAAVIFDPPTDTIAIMSTFLWLPLPLLLGGVFLTRPGLITLSVIASIAPFLLPIFAPTVSFGDVGQISSFVIIIAVVINMTSRYRDQIELDRQSEILATTHELQATSQSLEQRTRDLALVADVGREISQVRDLTKMLTDAVDLICDRFDLYHVQIYLTDPSGHSLLLRAGSGEIGQKLVEQNHRLPIVPGSISGTAASQKRAVVVTDTAESIAYRANPLLPHTHSEIAIPLLVGERVAGVLDLKSDQPGRFRTDHLSLFETLAAQLAIAIQNATLFTEAEQAQVAMEAHMQRLAKEDWKEFLNAVDRREWFGAAYELYVDTPLAELPLPAPEKHNLTVPIAIGGESVGAIRLEDSESHIWTENETIMALAVAEKVAQRVENLRLLSEAKRYQAKAEEAARRLVRDGWTSYQDQMQIDGYVYDQKEVTALQEMETVTDSADVIMQPLTIQGEIIGMFEADGVDEDDEETRAFLTAVAAQLSAHIETLRLAAQTEQALGETAVQARRLAQLNEMGNALSATDNVDEAFTAVTQYISNIISHDRLSLTLLTPDSNGLEVDALDGESGVISTGVILPLAGSAVGTALTQRQLLNISDLSHSDYLENEQLAAQGLRSTLIAPLITARGGQGTINLGSNAANAFDDGDENLLQQIAPLLASTIESQRLFVEAQKEAEKERLVNVITQKIQRAVTVESALETAVQELGQALQTRTTQISFNVSDTPLVQQTDTNGSTKR